MDVCGKCQGEGTRQVQLANGKTETKTCYVCGGRGRIPKEVTISRPGIQMGPTRVRPVQEPEKPKVAPRAPVAERQPEERQPVFRSPLSVPLGDFSWMKNRPAIAGGNRA